MADDGDDSRSEGSWGQVASGFRELGDRLRSGFDDLEDRDSATREEIRRAWAGFATAAQGLGQVLVVTTVNDPEIRTGANHAFGSLIDAVVTTVRDTAGSASARARRMWGTEDEQ